MMQEGWAGLAALAGLACMLTLLFLKGRALFRSLVSTIYQAIKDSGNAVIWIGKIVMAILAMIALWYIFTHGVDKPPIL